MDVAPRGPISLLRRLGATVIGAADAISVKLYAMIFGCPEYGFDWPNRLASE